MKASSEVCDAVDFFSFIDVATDVSSFPVLIIIFAFAHAPRPIYHIDILLFVQLLLKNTAPPWLSMNNPWSKHLKALALLFARFAILCHLCGIEITLSFGATNNTFGLLLGNSVCTLPPLLLFSLDLPLFVICVTLEPPSPPPALELTIPSAYCCFFSDFGNIVCAALLDLDSLAALDLEDLAYLG